MSTSTTRAPNLPAPPDTYTRIYMERLTNALRLYFAQMDNPGPSVLTTQRENGRVIAALNFSQYNKTVNTQVASIPTQDELTSLRVGDVYVDTTAGNVLKVKMT